MSNPIPNFNEMTQGLSFSGTPLNPRQSAPQSHLTRVRKSLRPEDFLLTLLAFSSSLAYYLVYKDLAVILISIVLSFMLIILLLLYHITEKQNVRHCQTIYSPILLFSTGLCFIFEDPDVIRSFIKINSEPSFLPSLLTLILLALIFGKKNVFGVNSTFASLVLGILSFCLTVNNQQLTGRAVFLFISLIFTVINTFLSKRAVGRKVESVKLDEILEDSECDLEFEEITTKLQETTVFLQELLVTSDCSSELIKQSILNLRIISKCLQKKSNIYSVKVNSVTKNMDEQDKIFIEESCFDKQFKSNEFPSRHMIKTQSEGFYGVTELIGLLKSIGKDWNFNTFFLSDCCNNTPLQVAGLYSFGHFAFDELFKIPSAVLKNFLQALEESYTSNPYHNSSHAADVMCSYSYLLYNSSLLQFISNIDILAGIVASLGHDAGHPAKNNRFLVITKHDLAIQYNDISVLEMLHSSLVFKLMQKTETNIFVNLTPDQWNLARKLIIEMILATDMSKHFELLGQFRGKHKNREGFDLANNDMKLELFRLIIKAADIGHAAKNIELHEKWCKLVVEEFYTQGDLEKQLGLPISMYCDRETTDISKSQAGFIKNIVLPLFTAINFVLDSEMIECFCIEQLKANEQYWLCRRKTIRGRSLVVKEGEYVNALNNLAQVRSTIRKPSLPHKFLS